MLKLILIVVMLSSGLLANDIKMYCETYKWVYINNKEECFGTNLVTEERLGKSRWDMNVIIDTKTKKATFITKNLGTKDSTNSSGRLTPLVDDREISKKSKNIDKRNFLYVGFTGYSYPFYIKYNTDKATLTVYDSIYGVYFLKCIPRM